MMRTTTRIVLGLMLALAAGCGSKKDDPPPATKTPADDPKPAPSATPPATTATAVPPIIAPPPPKPAAWELDPSKHDTPSAPATGKLGGAAFTPTAEFMGDTLSLRVLKDMNPEREIRLTFSPEQLKAVQGLKLSVKPDATVGAAVPVVETLVPDPKPNARGPLVFHYPNGYALTLELGKKANGKLPGKVFLSLPGDDKSFVAGTFTADWVRLPSLPPEPDEAPFVHGTVGVVNSPATNVSVGYIGAGKSGTLHIDMIGIELAAKGVSARSDMSNPPRVSLVAAGEGAGKPGRYDHTRLEPGRYLIYARAGVDGPAAWQWVTVEADTKAVVNLEVDGAKAGKVEVTVPAGATAEVGLVPPTDPADKFPTDLRSPMAFGLGLYVKPVNGKATFPRVGPGKYDVFAGTLTGTVTVETGKTATVELKPAEKK